MRGKSVVIGLFTAEVDSVFEGAFFPGRVGWTSSFVRALFHASACAPAVPSWRRCEIFLFRVPICLLLLRAYSFLNKVQFNALSVH